jgi:DDE superfamily endonuclease
VALFLPGRAHDALKSRLLRVMPFCTRALMRLLIAFCKKRCHRAEGYLCLDDAVIEKAFARKLPWAGWTYSFAEKRKVYGLCTWCFCGAPSLGALRVPVAFRLWRPKRSCARHAYRTKLKLAGVMLKEVIGSELEARYIVFDTHYTAPGGSRRWSRGSGASCGSGRSIRGRSSTGGPRGAPWASWPGCWL